MSISKDHLALFHLTFCFSWEFWFPWAKIARLANRTGKKTIRLLKLKSKKKEKSLKILWYGLNTCEIYNYSEYWRGSATSEVNVSCYCTIRVRAESEPVWKDVYNRHTGLRLFIKWIRGELQMILKNKVFKLAFRCKLSYHIILDDFQCHRAIDSVDNHMKRGQCVLNLFKFDKLFWLQ